MSTPVESAIAEATALLGPGATTWIAQPAFDWDRLTPLALTIDADGVLPGKTGYVDTPDPSWLAGLAASQFENWQIATGVTTKLQVDGDSIEIAAPDWGAVAARMFQASPIYTLLRGAGYLHLDGSLSRYRPTSLQV